MKEKVRKGLKYVILGIFFGFISFGVHMISTLKERHYFEKNYIFEVYRQNIELDYYGAKDTLTDAIDSYIKEIAPLSVMNGITFVNKCDEYDMDLFFVIAQAQVESTFATKGLGHKTNSAFNVKAYDGKGSKHMDKYHHPDESIEPYILLVKKYYMGDSKTEMDLLDNYVDLNNKRYASNTDYEMIMLSTYKKLRDRYGKLYDDFLKYKTLSRK